MPAVESQMLALGTQAPAFALPDPDGIVHTMREDASAYLVMFICNHCPFVIHVADELARIGNDYQAKNVAVYAINSNDSIKYPTDGPEPMRQVAAERGYTFPYLIDAEQDIAKAYCAACTPDFFLFDADRLLVYRGQLDGSRPGNTVPVDGEDLRHAIDAVLACEAVAEDQVPSIGCSIKWLAGNEPAYFG